VRSLWRRETDFPEIERFVNEGHTIGVEIALDADFTDDADFGFAIGFERAANQFLLGNEFVTRQDAGSVKANNDGFSLLGEHTAFAIAGTSPWQPGEGAKRLSTDNGSEKRMMAKEM
jgi:hypothetical protein